MESIDYGDLVAEIGYYVVRNCNPSWRIGQAYIDFIDLTYITEGEAEYIIDGINYKVAAGDMVCIPKGHIREANINLNPEKLMKLYCANFQLWDLKGNDVNLPFPIVSHIGIHSDILSLYKNLTPEWIRRMPGFRLKVRGIFSLILHRMLELTVYKVNLPGSDVRIDRVVQYIINHYADDLRVGTFAQQLNLNAAYFGTLFKTVTGMSFQQFVMETRINNAEDMLRSSGCSVREVAAICGFHDAFYFSKVFKQKYGYPPSKLLK